MRSVLTGANTAQADSALGRLGWSTDHLQSTKEVPLGVSLGKVSTCPNEVKKISKAL
jgi:hypothetical protein